MAIHRGPKIVTNGLVLALDAGSTKSYPGTGNTWFDRSGNRFNGTLTNGPTFNSANGGSIVFDGVDDYVSTNLTCGTSFTWNVWFKTDVLFGSGYRNILSIKTPNYILMLMDDDTPNMGFWTSDGLNGESLNMNSISTNVWYYATLVREGNSITNGYKTYLNAVSKGSFNTGTWSSSDVLILGGRTDTSQYLDGNIACAQIYNRALTASEILQNFTVQRGRFGI